MTAASSILLLPDLLLVSDWASSGLSMRFKTNRKISIKQVFIVVTSIRFLGLGTYSTEGSEDVAKLHLGDQARENFEILAELHEFLDVHHTALISVEAVV